MFVCVTDRREDDQKIEDYLMEGARVLATALKSWTHKKDVSILPDKTHLLHGG